MAKVNFILKITILSFFAWFLLIPLTFAQTPSCAALSDAGNSYDSCTGSGASQVCERLVCNGTSFIPLELWTTAGTKNIDFGNDTSTCNSTRLGRLRYQGGSTWQYCNGTAWTNFNLIPDQSNLYCWGQITASLRLQRSPFAFTSITSGPNAICGIFANGRPTCIHHRPDTAPIDSAITGASYVVNTNTNGNVCLIDSNTQIKCYNKDGAQLTTMGGQAVPTDTGYVKIAGAEFGSDVAYYGLKSNGTVVGWGSSDITISGTVTDIAAAVNYGGAKVVYIQSGQLLGNLDRRNISPNSNFVKVNAHRGGCFCGVRSDGTTDCGGFYFYAGGGVDRDCPDPVAGVVSGGADVALTLNEYDSPDRMTVCVLKTNGTVQCAGNNEYNLVSHGSGVVGGTAIVSNLSQEPERFFCAVATSKNTSIP